MARALALLGRFEEAIPVLQAEIQLAPRAGVNHHLLGEVYLQRKEYEKAIQSFGRAIAIQPDLAWPHYGLATACARLGRREESKRHREKFRTLSARGQKAGRHWREAYDSMKVSRQSVAHSHTIAGRVYRSRGDEGSAERIWKRAAAIDPRASVCRAELAALYMQKGRFSDALPLCGQLTEIQPRNGVHHLHLGQVHARLGRFEEAERAYRKVTEVAPERPEGYRALAELYVQTGRNLPEARTLASRAVALQPIAPHYVVLAMACHRGGDRAGALAAIRRAVRMDPGNADYRRIQTLIEGRK
jgi:tetratricopeptide (TPR) repeat protein